MFTFTTTAYNLQGEALETETQKHYTHLQVVMESYKSEPKTVKTETETITPYYGKVNNFQIRGLRSILQENTQKPLCNELFQFPNECNTNSISFAILSI